MWGDTLGEEELEPSPPLKNRRSIEMTDAGFFPFCLGFGIQSARMIQITGVNKSGLVNTWKQAG